MFALYSVTLLAFVGSRLALFCQFQFSVELEDAQTRADALAAVILPTISDSVVIGDDDTIARTLERAVRHSSFSQAAYIDLKGHHVRAQRSDPIVLQPPDWLTRLVADRLYDTNLPITVGGRDYGVPRLRFAPALIAGDMWRLALGALVLGAIGDAVLTLDAGGQVLLANPAAALLFGQPQEQLLRQPVQALLPVAFGDAGQAAEPGHTRWAPWRGRLVQHGQGEAARTLDSTLSTILGPDADADADADADTVGLVLACRDVTEAHRLDQRLRDDLASREAALRTLRGVVADFKPPDERAGPQLQGLVDGVRVRVDRNKVHQALGNVLSNAYKYSPGDGAGTLRLLPGSRAGQPGVGGGPAQQPWGIAMQDQGMGMAAAQLARERALLPCRCLGQHPRHRPGHGHRQGDHRAAGRPVAAGQPARRRRAGDTLAAGLGAGGPCTMNATAKLQPHHVQPRPAEPAQPWQRLAGHHRRQRPV